MILFDWLGFWFKQNVLTIIMCSVISKIAGVDRKVRYVKPLGTISSPRISPLLPESESHKTQKMLAINSCP